MPTAIVSGRVDATVKERADAHILAAGLTVGEVINIVWENIAKTGHAPVSAAEQETEVDPLERFFAFCDSPEQLEDSDWLTNLSVEGMREFETNRLMEKYYGDQQPTAAQLQS